MPDGMYCRDVKPADLLDGLSVDPTHAGFELVGEAKALAVWNTLLCSPAFHSVIVEADPPVGQHKILGFGASVYVVPEFVDAQLANPQPGLNARLVKCIDAAEPVVLNEKGIRHQNTYAGLDMVIFYGCWRNCVPPESLREMQMLLATAFVEKHIGHRHNRFLYEATNETDRIFMRDSHVYRFVSHFDDFHRQNSGNTWNRDRSLGIATRAEALSVPGSAMAMLFHYHEPKLRLHDSDQELLSAALTGLTDRELAEKLDLKVGAVKKRWLALFGRIADAHPNLLPLQEIENGGNGRGPQKRHHVLAYIRTHPEELRPMLSMRRSSKLGPAPPAQRLWE